MSLSCPRPGAPLTQGLQSFPRNPVHHPCPPANTPSLRAGVGGAHQEAFVPSHCPQRSTASPGPDGASGGSGCAVFISASLIPAASGMRALGHVCWITDVGVNPGPRRGGELSSDAQPFLRPASHSVKHRAVCCHRSLALPVLPRSPHACAGRCCHTRHL